MSVDRLACSWQFALVAFIINLTINISNMIINKTVITACNKALACSALTSSSEN